MDDRLEALLTAIRRHCEETDVGHELVKAFDREDQTLFDEAWIILKSRLDEYLES